MSLRDTFPHFQIKRDKAPSIKSFIVKWFYYTKFNNMNFIWLIKTFYRLSSEITFHVLRDSWISCKEQWKSCLKALIFFVSFFVNWNVIICVWTKILRLPKTIRMHQTRYSHVLRKVLQSFSYIWCLEWIWPHMNKFGTLSYANSTWNSSLNNSIHIARMNEYLTNALTHLPSFSRH